jgi:ATP-binding cassette, subfamily A (ABC1), member 3
LFILVKYDCIAVGTTKDLEDRYATYQVHFSARTREEILCVQELMSQIAGAKMADDVATRFEVPVKSQDDGVGSGLSLRRLFHILSTQDSSFSVEKANLESVFLKVIRRNNISEEDTTGGKGKWRMC